MNKILNILFFMALMFFAVNAYAGYYDYTFKNLPGNQTQCTVSGSSTDFLIQIVKEIA